MAMRFTLMLGLGGHQDQGVIPAPELFGYIGGLGRQVKAVDWEEKHE